MTILFTGIGRRVELVQAFRNVAEKNNIDLKIIGADVVSSAPALYFCDMAEIVPRVDAPDYIDVLVDICKKEHVSGLIPTTDRDLLILSKTKQRFEEIGTTVFVSTEDKVALCRDKRLTTAFFRSCGLLAPETIDDVEKYDLGFPAFIKPKDGSSSISAYEVKDREELLSFAKRVPDYIIQPFVSGIEYTIDAFCDLEGNPIYITPRIRLAVRSGEVLKTQIAQDKQIIEEIKALIKNFKPVGPITIQVVREKTTGKDFYIEINPRFGGGSPLSIKAGADSAEALLRLLNEEKLSYADKAAEDGAIYSRFDQSVRVK